MNITNGTVSRAYKVADYETRTVSLSFTLDPGDDVDAATKKVVLLAERHARMTPEAKSRQELRKQFSPEEAKAEPEVNPTTQAGNAVVSTGVGTSLAVEVDVTDLGLQRLCQWATKTTGDHEMVKTTVKEFSPTPPHKIASMPAENRLTFVATLKSKVNG